MIIILIRTLALYVIVLATIRFMGKGELTEMQPYEMVIMLMIAELAALSIEDTGTPILNSIVAIITLLFAQVVISYATMKSETVRRIICGMPSMLIKKGKINQKELERLRINLNDLIEQVRLKDYSNLADVEFAILETNGELSIIPKANKRPVTMEDIRMLVPEGELPLSLIIDGRVHSDNLQSINKNMDWLNGHLKMHGIEKPQDVLFCFIDDQNKVHVQKKEEK